MSNNLRYGWTKRQIFAFKKKKQLAQRVLERILKNFKSNSKNDFIRPCYLGNKCSDQEYMLIWLNSERCKKCSLPIQKNCSTLQNWVIKEHYYCCNDCYLCHQMIGDGFPYKFVTFYKMKNIIVSFKLMIQLKKLLWNFI